MNKKKVRIMIILKQVGISATGSLIVMMLGLAFGELNETVRTINKKSREGRVEYTRRFTFSLNPWKPFGGKIPFYKDPQNDK